MKQEAGSNLQPILAALLLSLLTLGVFFILRDYGPESAVRRFHQASMAQDPTALSRVTTQPINDENVRTLGGIVNELIAGGSQIRLGSVKRSPDQVVAEFRYVRPPAIHVILWNVKRTKGGWKVDAKATLQTLHRFMGL